MSIFVVRQALGDEEFVRRMQAKIQTVQTDVNNPKRQRRPPAPSLEHLASQHVDRNQAILAAYRTGQYSYQKIGAFFWPAFHNRRADCARGRERMPLGFAT